ncbi:ABC transporter permease [Comamonas composti]|uniref:ABC transporter permease n=1 Tax=Comamonas composti TaxID=408558 RepID=UPI0003F6E385|nr:ABC transporter permease [Comamonas composti]
MLLREAVARLSASRGAWAWLVLEPVVHVLFMLVIFTVIRARTLAGADVTIWLLLGMSCFFTARNVFQRSMGALSANAALFAYRQVRPADTVFVRAALEILLGLVVAAFLVLLVSFVGHDISPPSPLQAMAAYAGTMLCGLGLGLMLSVAGHLISEVQQLVSFLLLPLYLLSGVIFPLSAIPVQYREWVFLNPFAHGIELLRSSFFPIYHAAPEANFGYLYGFALVSIFLGLALHVRFTERLRAQ